MEKDLIQFKKWFKNLGLEIDEKIDDEVLKTLMPPQRRDLWRNIMRHVLPEKEVDLIKKSILLHKLLKRQKPLMAKVESDKDLVNALKYEELITKYNKIQKEIVDTKENNYKMKIDLNEKIEYKKNLIKNINLKENIIYLVKHKTENYSKFIEMLNEKSNICKHFSIEVNDDLTKTDYEDSLIKCLTEVDNAKQSGIMNDNVNVGKKLCNDIYTTIKNKSPTILIQTIEENLIDHINKSNSIITEEKEISEHNNDHKNVVNELLAKLFQKQLELKSKLTNSLVERNNVIKQLKETVAQEKNEIQNQYKLKYISNTNQESQAFEKNLNESIQAVITNSINYSKITGFHDNVSLENEKLKKLDDIFEKINFLNDEINQKKTMVSEMLKEFIDKKSDFGLIEMKTSMDKLAEDHLKKVNYSLINEKIMCIKDNVSSDIDNMNKYAIGFIAKPSVLNVQTLKYIKHHFKMINVFNELNSKFELLNKTLCLTEENSISIITQKENLHKLEFNCIMDKMENNILDLHSSIEDCKLIADVMSTMRLQNIPSSK